MLPKERTADSGQNKKRTIKLTVQDSRPEQCLHAACTCRYVLGKGEGPLSKPSHSTALLDDSAIPASIAAQPHLREHPEGRTASCRTACPASGERE